jgi:hypothetical protein
MAVGLSILGVIVMLYCLVSFGFFTYISIKPEAPKDDKKFKPGIYTMAGLSLLMALICLYFINFTCGPDYKTINALMKSSNAALGLPLK